MIKKLSKHGNSRASVIESAVLDLLEITDETPLKITTDGNKLIIAPVTEEYQEQLFQAAMAKSHRMFKADFKKLAKK